MRRICLLFIMILAATTARAQAIPDFSGIWGHPYWPGFEPPASGPGPVTNRSRLRGGPQKGVSDPRQLVGDYTYPILKPQAAEFVKKHGEMELSGVGAPTPTNQCWPEPVPTFFGQLQCGCSSSRTRPSSCTA